VCVNVYDPILLLLKRARSCETTKRLVALGYKNERDMGWRSHMKERRLVYSAVDSYQDGPEQFTLDPGRLVK